MENVAVPKIDQDALDRIEADLAAVESVLAAMDQIAASPLDEPGAAARRIADLVEAADLTRPMISDLIGDRHLGMVEQMEAFAEPPTSVTFSATAAADLDVVDPTPVEVAHPLALGTEVFLDHVDEPAVGDHEDVGVGFVGGGDSSEGVEGPLE